MLESQIERNREQIKGAEAMNRIYVRRIEAIGSQAQEMEAQIDDIRELSKGISGVDGHEVQLEIITLTQERNSLLSKINTYTSKREVTQSQLSGLVESIGNQEILLARGQKMHETAERQASNIIASR